METIIRLPTNLVTAQSKLPKPQAQIMLRYVWIHVTKQNLTNETKNRAFKFSIQNHRTKTPSKRKSQGTETFSYEAMDAFVFIMDGLMTMSHKNYIFSWSFGATVYLK